MNNNTIKEGRLSFTFIDADEIQKYDEWSHYRNRFNSVCNGSKAVDFIVIKEETTWLIEVKDYRFNKRTKSYCISEEIAAKVRDTIAGLVSAKFTGIDKDEARISKKVLASGKIKVLLHLEEPRETKKLHRSSTNNANILINLKQRLKFIDPHPRIVNSNNFPTGLGSVRTV